MAAVFDDRVKAEDFLKAVKARGFRAERQYLDQRRRRGAVLPCGRNSAPQCRVLARFRGQDGASAEQSRSDAVDDVRSRHGGAFAREEDDRLGEGRPQDAGAGGDIPDAVLFVRRLQSGACQANSGRRARQLQVEGPIVNRRSFVSESDGRRLFDSAGRQRRFGQRSSSYSQGEGDEDVSTLLTAIRTHSNRQLRAYGWASR